MYTKSFPLTVKTWRTGPAASAAATLRFWHRRAAVHWFALAWRRDVQALCLCAWHQRLWLAKKTSFGAKKYGGIFVVAFVDLNLKNHWSFSGRTLSQFFGATSNESLDSKANAKESLTGIAIIGWKMHKQTKLIMHLISMKNIEK